MPEKSSGHTTATRSTLHTLKPQVVIDGRTRGVICTAQAHDPVHDFALYKRSKVEPHESLEVLTDSGYQDLD